MRLQPVAIGVDDEGGVVARPVIRPETRLAIVLPAFRQRRAMEGSTPFGVGATKEKCRPDSGSAGTGRATGFSQNWASPAPKPTLSAES